jgi:hypothetical protein
MEYAVDPVAVAVLAGRWDAVASAALLARARVPPDVPAGGEAGVAMRRFLSVLGESLGAGAQAAATAADALAAAARAYADADASLADR